MAIIYGNDVEKETKEIFSNFSFWVSNFASVVCVSRCRLSLFRALSWSGRAKLRRAREKVERRLG